MMPVRVDARTFAGGVEKFDLIGWEVPADSAEVFFELFFGACADDEAGDGRALQEPVEGDLGDGFAGFFGDGV